MTLNKFQPTTPFETIVTGFALSMIGDILSMFTGYATLNIFLGLFGLFLILKGFDYFRRHNLLRNPFHGLSKLLFGIYFLLCIVMIIRGYLIDYPYPWFSTLGCLNFHLLQGWYLWCYFMPLIAFIPTEYYSFIIISVYAKPLAIISIFIAMFNYQDVLDASLRNSVGMELENDHSYGVTFAGVFMPLSFIILFKRYILKSTWMWSMAAMIISIVFTVMAARRGSLAVSAGLFLIALFVYVKSLPRGLRFTGYLGCIILIGIMVFSLIHSSLTDFLMVRGVEDDRSAIDEAVLDQMTDFERWFGKGLNGRYYFPLHLGDDPYKGWRYTSETGFYTLVLKGGFVLAYTYVLMMALVAIRGYRKSQNVLCKGGALFILLNLFALYPGGWLNFDIKFLVIWMFMGLCLNDSVLKMSDEEIQYNFF